MVARDQPTIFGDQLIAALSSKNDGNLKFGLGDDAEALENRKKFLAKIGIDIHHTSLVGITYDTGDFTKYRMAVLKDKSVGMLQPDMTQYVDALVVRDSNHALFLPLADCAGAIIYDPKHKVLMVSHLGRHSVEQNGATKSIQYLQEKAASNPADLLVWISPSVGKATYPLHAFGGKSLQEVIVEQLIAVGIKNEHIEASSIDTARDENYFSHSEFLKGNEEAGRFAIAVQMNKE